MFFFLIKFLYKLICICYFMERILYKVPASMLMGFGSHFGSLLSRDWNSDSSAYIHSRIYSRFFINLSIASFVVSKAIKFIHFFNSRKLRFLYFLHEGFQNFLFDSDKFDIFTKNFFLIKDWVPGVLTNYKIISSKIAKFSRDITNLKEYPNGLIFLGSVGTLTLASRESRISKSPSIGLVDVDNGFSPFSYSVPSNNKSFSIFFAYYSLFSYASFYGGQIADFLYSKTGQFKFSKFVKHFYYFLTFRSPMSNLNRINFSKLTEFGPSLKGFRFFIKNPQYVRFRLKFQRLYLDFFTKASLPRLKGFFKYKGRKGNNRRYNYQDYNKNERFNNNKFFGDFDKFTKGSHNKKFIKGLYNKKFTKDSRKIGEFALQKGRKRKFNFRKKQKF